MAIDKEKIISETSIQLSRSSGPGGQHVNKVNTRVELFFNISASAAFTPKEKERLLKRLEKQLDKQNTLRVVDQSSRSQSKNKFSAFAKLFDILEKALVIPKKRIPTKKSKAKKIEVLNTKRKRSVIKKLRGPVKRNDI